nr:transglutaminase domain-containing protein [Pseudenhygromyxa sp. WMMC2535]
MWPQASEPHPLIVDLPSAAEVSIEALAAYVVEHERDPFGRVKALHDYVATRVAYDYETYKAGGPFPSQSAEHVFATRTSVCAGYANLLAALVTEAGGEAVVVSGYSRKLGGGLSGEGHAWNAVKIEGEWYLVDATWDAGGASPEGDWRFEYGSDYLFAPPEIIGLTHFPDDPGWQLRTRPLERGEFLRQPMLRPRFFADGFEPITELRSHFDVDEALSVSLANHDGQFVLAHAVSSEGAVDCSVLGRQTLEIRCELPRRGQYEVQIFANDERYGDFHYVGSLAVNRVS